MLIDAWRQVYRRHVDVLNEKALLIIATIFPLAILIVSNINEGKWTSAVYSIDYIIILLQNGNQKEKKIPACALHRLTLNEENRSLIAEKSDI